MGVTEPSESNKTFLIKDPDGKYCWLHETNLYTNPVYLFLTWKIFFFIWLGVDIFVLLIVTWGHNPLDELESLISIGSAMFYVLLGILILIAISYYIYALIMHGKYSVLFEMDNKGVRHTQLSNDFNKAKKVGTLTTLAGMASGNLSAVGSGLLASAAGSMYTEFKKVRSIKTNQRRHVIKLRSSDMMHNQVHTAPEDFDFVLGFIKEQVKLSSAKGGSDR